jgi:hypothetical protein
MMSYQDDGQFLDPSQNYVPTDTGGGDGGGGGGGDWFDQNPAPASAEDTFAQQVTTWYQQYLGRTPSAQEIESHRGNPGGLAAVEQVIKKAAGTPAEPNAPKPSGNTSGLPAWASKYNTNDPATLAVVQSFAKKGIEPRPGDVDYWVGKINQTGGWANEGNKSYWLDRMSSQYGGVGDYGESGKVGNEGNYRTEGGGGGATTNNPNASSYDPATFGALNKPFGETFNYGDWGGSTPFVAPEGSTMPDFNPNVPAVAPYQNPMGAFSFGGYGGTPAGQGMSLAQMGGRAGGSPIDPNQASTPEGRATWNPTTGEWSDTQGLQTGWLEPRPPGEVRGAPTPTGVAQYQTGGVDPREVAPTPFTYQDYNNPAGNFSFTRPEVAPLTIDEYKNPQGEFSFTRAEPGAFTYADYQAPAAFTAPTEADMTQDPSYRIRLKESLDAAQKSAAAKGTLMTGGTLKALAQYGGEQASKEYANIYGRNLNTYQTNAAQGLTSYQTNLDKAKTEYGAARDAYDKAYEQAKSTYGVNADQYMQQYAANVAKKKTEYDAAVQSRDTAYGQASDTWSKNRGAYDTSWTANYGKAKDQYGAAVDAQKTLYDQKLGIYNTNAGQYDTAWNASKNLSDTAYNQQAGTYGLNAANKAGQYQNAYTLWNAQNAAKKDDWQTNYQKSLDAYKTRYDIWNSQNANQFDRLYKLSALGQGSW